MTIISLIGGSISRGGAVNRVIEAGFQADTRKFGLDIRFLVKNGVWENGES